MPMLEPLSAETLARMKAEHVPVDSGLDDGRTICNSNACWTDDGNDGDAEFFATFFPCDAALLLAELERYKTDGMSGWRSCNQFWIESSHA